MPAYRYFIDETLKLGEATLSETESHHLQKVMRGQVGDEIELINGRGALATASVSALLKKEVRVQISHIEVKKRETNLILIQALPTMPHLELLVEKGVELGMNALYLFKGERSQSHFSESKFNRIKLKQIAALKQSGRLYLPEIHLVNEFSNLSIKADFLCYGDVREQAPPLYKALGDSKEIVDLAFCCGPESGLSPMEIKLLESSGYVGISLHSNILRAESAPLAFLALAHHYLRLHSDAPIVN